MFTTLLQTTAGAVTALAEKVDTLANTASQTGINPTAPSTGVAESFSVFSILIKGGVIMIPLGLLLLIVIFVLVERLITLSKANKTNPQFMPGIKDLVLAGNLDAAKAMCKSMNTPESNMILKGITRVGRESDEIRKTMEECGSVEVTRLEKNMSMLQLIGRVAPLLGFIGTILGVITIFRKIAAANTVDIGVISEGLYQKMITSAGGLIVGVLAFIFYHWMNTKIDKVAKRLEESKMEFMDILNEPAK